MQEFEIAGVICFGSERNCTARAITRLVLSKSRVPDDVAGFGFTFG
jgi:hypothetical protein